jgi:hypothetical protein
MMASIESFDNDSDNSMDISDEEDYKITTSSSPDKRLLLVTSIVILDWAMNSRVNCGIELPFDTAIYRYSDIESMTEEELAENKVPENSVCYKLLQKGDRFYRVTNMTPAEYIELCSVLRHDYYSKPKRVVSNNNEHDGENANSYPRINARNFCIFDALLLYLMVVDGVGMDYIGIIWDCNQSTVFEYAEFVAELVNSDLENDLKWPSASERKNRYGTMECYEKAIAIIDGTHCQIKRPVDIGDENDYYSGYKHRHTQNFLIIVDAYGFILYLDGPFPGSVVDITACRVTDLFRNISNYLSPGERILGDGGFESLPRVITQFDKSKLDAVGVTLTERNKMKNFNLYFGNMRARVEHKIHRTKARATSLIQRFTRNKKRQFKTIKSACILNNYVLRKRIAANLD